MGLLVRPGGSLITVMYPTVEKDVDLSEGPPYEVSVKEYEKVLNGFVKKDGPVMLLDDQFHSARGGGMTWWCRWERVEGKASKTKE